MICKNIYEKINFVGINGFNINFKLIVIVDIAKLKELKSYFYRYL